MGVGNAWFVEGTFSEVWTRMGTGNREVAPLALRDGLRETIGVGGGIAFDACFLAIPIPIPTPIPKDGLPIPAVPGKG